MRGLADVLRSREIIGTRFIDDIEFARHGNQQGYLMVVSRTYHDLTDQHEFDTHKPAWLKLRESMRGMQL